MSHDQIVRLERSELVTSFMLIKVFCVVSMLSKLRSREGEQQASCGISTGTD